MSKRAVIPPAAQEAAAALNMSPGIVSGGFAFLTGLTGAGPDGNMPSDPEDQFRHAFHKIRGVLEEAGATMDDVVEMTSYHIGLRGHFDVFDKVRLEVFSPPFPAWTAVEVAGLRREGALVEIRVIARVPGQAGQPSQIP